MFGDLSREPDAYKKTTSVESTIYLFLLQNAKIHATLDMSQKAHPKKNQKVRTSKAFVIYIYFVLVLNFVNQL